MVIEESLITFSFQTNLVEEENASGRQKLFLDRDRKRSIGNSKNGKYFRVGIGMM